MSPTNFSLALLIMLPVCVEAADAVAPPKTTNPSSASRTEYSMEDNRCGGEGNFKDMQCLDGYLKWLDGQLNRTYGLALKKLPERDEMDSRKEREQLRKSQRAWLKYKDENCALSGALDGGSNAWVTHFAMACMEHETKERIKFLQRIVDNE